METKAIADKTHQTNETKKLDLKTFNFTHTKRYRDFRKSLQMGLFEPNKYFVVGEGSYSKVYDIGTFGDPQIYSSGYKLVLKNFAKLRDEATKTKYGYKLDKSILIEISSLYSLMNLSHIPVIHDAIVSHEFSGYVMDRFFGGTLRGLIPSLTSEASIKHVMYQLLTAINNCHSRFIIHCDVKPENIFLTKTKDTGYKIHIGDFGLAHFTIDNKMVVRNNEVQTLWYRAPEAILGTQTYSSKIDIWSAGIIMLELYTRCTGYVGTRHHSNPHQYRMQVFKLGNPSESDVKALLKYVPKDTTENKITGYTGRSRTAILEQIEGFRALYPYTRKEFAKDLKMKVSHISSKGIELLLGLLDYNPDTRFDTITALNHPYFSDVQIKSIGTPCGLSPLKEGTPRQLSNVFDNIYELHTGNFNYTNITTLNPWYSRKIRSRTIMIIAEICSMLRLNIVIFSQIMRNHDILLSNIKIKEKEIDWYSIILLLYMSNIYGELSTTIEDCVKVIFPNIDNTYRDSMLRAIHLLEKNVFNILDHNIYVKTPLMYINHANSVVKDPIYEEASNIMYIVSLFCPEIIGYHDELVYIAIINTIAFKMYTSFDMEVPEFKKYRSEVEHLKGDENKNLNYVYDRIRLELKTVNFAKLKFIMTRFGYNKLSDTITEFFDNIKDIKDVEHVDEIL